LRQGIIFKSWRETGYERFIRATIVSAQDNDRLLAALAVLNPR
jgi:histidinol-phosphate aminotransferase